MSHEYRFFLPLRQILQQPFIINHIWGAALKYKRLRGVSFHLLLRAQRASRATATTATAYSVRAELGSPQPSHAACKPSRATLAASESLPRAACEPSHRQRVCEREASICAAALDYKHPPSSSLSTLYIQVRDNSHPRACVFEDSPEQPQEARGER